MDPIKNAFLKIKNEIELLKNEILELRFQIKQVQILQNKTPQQTNNQTYIQTNPTHISTQTPQQTNNQTYIQTNPTHILQVKGLYDKNLSSSIRNKGVPTNKPTNTQTNQQTQYTLKNQNIYTSEFSQAKNILESLDHIKKGIRIKFKQLTPQEMLVFSTLYALEEEKNSETTYRTLAQKIGLSESSIRDYINKLTKKGIPVEKIRQNNKIIILKISQDLKKIATLDTIQNLREL